MPDGNTAANLPVSESAASSSGREVRKVTENDRPYANPIKTWAADPDLWRRRCTPEGCPFCTEAIWSTHVELAASWVIIPDRAPLPGYVLVVSKSHVIEPFELTPTEGAQFWDDCMRTARAVASVVHPVKLNYEIHDNTIPHLHLHIFPRFVGDPFEASPIDPHRTGDSERKAGEIDALREAIMSLP